MNAKWTKSIAVGEVFVLILLDLTGIIFYAKRFIYNYSLLNLKKYIFSCKCNQYGFCGNLCSLDDPCVQNPCANGGICVEKCTDVVDYFCNCSAKYIGKNCTEEVSLSA